MSEGIVEAFREAGSQAGVPTDHVAAGLSAAAADRHYGFIMRDNLEAATSLLTEDGQNLPLDEIPTAMLALGWLLSASGHDYRRGGAPSADGEAWAVHMGNVRAGRIVTVEPPFWMTAAQGERQARLADEILNSASPGVELVLSALNYGVYFKPETMAGAARTLAKSPEEVAAAEELEAMPHLSVANWAIGQAVQHFYEKMAASDSGRLHLIDMCSGTGATLAAITNRLAVANDRGYGMDGDRLSVTSFESTPSFYEQLTEGYLKEAIPQLGAAGIGLVETAPLAGFHNSLRAGDINLVAGDVVEGIARLDLSTASENDVVLATANYGFHRLSSTRKAGIIQKLGEVENSVIVIGDLRQNGSAVNRGYFNMSNNGPLNAGNIGLEAILEENGYEARTIGYAGFSPRFIDRTLLDRLSAQLRDDGFLTIAVKGPKVQEFLLDR